MRNKQPPEEFPFWVGGTILVGAIAILIIGATVGPYRVELERECYLATPIEHRHLCQDPQYAELTANRGKE